MRRRPAVASSGSLLVIATGRRGGRSEAARVAGGRGRAAGESFELALGAVNDWYDRRGVAAIEKVHAPTAGWGSSLRVLPSTVDYAGTIYEPLWKGQRGIVFDAKSVAGQTTFGVDTLPKGKEAAKHIKRFLAQVGYLRGRRDRHGYVAGFLLYDCERDTLAWCGPQHLDALLAGESVRIRDDARGAAAASPTWRLPTLNCPLERAAILDQSTQRPMMDYLTLIQRAL